MSRQSEYSKPNYKKMMTESSNWVLWPILPVKRRQSAPPGVECGILYADGKPTVYIGNMFEIRDLKTCPKKEYKDFDALLADGWVVD